MCDCEQMAIAALCAQAHGERGHGAV